MGNALRIFRVVATEFADLSEDTVTAWFELTAPLIGKKIFGKLYDAHGPSPEDGRLW